MGIDGWIIAAYFLSLLGVSLWRHRKPEHEVGFLLSGRKLTLPAFVATLVSTWYGGILGIGEYSYQQGVVTWTVLGLPFYLFSILYALVLSARIRRHPALTLPEALGQQYGPRAGYLGALYVFVLVSPAPYLLMLAWLFQHSTGQTGGFLFYVLAVAVFSAAYVMWGGFQAVVRTDEVQLALMYLGFALLLWKAMEQAGPPEAIWHRLPPEHRSLTGGQSLQYLLVWFFIALWTFVDPAFHQRVAAARTPAVARRGILLSVLAWMLFDAMTILSGLYGRVLLEQVDPPAMVYPHLADRLLPPGFRGLFYVALLATIMSTLDSYLFLSGQTLGRDLLARRWPHRSPIALVRWSIVLAALLGIGLLLLVPGVVNLWYTIGSVIVPGLLLPVLGVYLPLFRVGQRHILAMMGMPVLVSLLWLLVGQVQGAPWLGIEPFYPGLLVSLLFWLGDRLRGGGRSS